jgi:hypothetical protein
MLGSSELSLGAADVVGANDMDGCSEGIALGCDEGCELGPVEGWLDGCELGLVDGWLLGCAEILGDMLG